jgi:uncharacterized protein HemX
VDDKRVVQIPISKLVIAGLCALAIVLFGRSRKMIQNVNAKHKTRLEQEQQNAQKQEAFQMLIDQLQTELSLNQEALTQLKNQLNTHQEQVSTLQIDLQSQQETFNQLQGNLQSHSAGGYATEGSVQLDMTAIYSG